MKGKKVRVVKRLGILAICLSITVAGTIRIVQQYRTGAGYQPDTSAYQRDLNENQVIFSNQSDEQLKSDETSSKDSELWEQDFDADRKLSREQIPDTNYLFKAQGQTNGNQLILPGQPETSLGGSATAEGADGIQPIGGGTLVLDPSADQDSADVVIRVPDGTTGITDGAGTDNSPSDNPDSKPSTPTPAPNPTPDSNAEVDIPDPAPIKPGDLLAGDSIFDSHPFPEKGLDSTKIDENGNQIAIDYKLKVVTGGQFGLNGHTFYQGEEITPEKILATAAYYIYDKDAGDQLYQLAAYGDCFRMDSYAKTADGKTLIVQFSFRPNADSAWFHQEGEFAIKDCKLMLLRDGDRRPIELYADLGDTIELSRFYYMMQPDAIVDQLSEQSVEPTISEVFPGWHRWKETRSVGLTYTLTETGRTILYPMDMIEVPEDMTAQLSYLYTPMFTTGWDKKKSEDMTWGQYYYYPVITQMPNQKEWDIPEGIMCADGGYSFDDFDIFGDITYHTATEIYIPSTLVMMGSVFGGNVYEEALPAEDAYVTQMNNPSYYAEDGILYNADQTEIEAIPFGRTSVVVPKTVTKVQLSNQNQIQNLSFASKNAPEIELYNLYGATIYIPKQYEAQYFVAWGSAICSGTNDIKTIDEKGTVSDPSLGFENGFLLSADHKELFLILPDVRGLCEIPDTVTTIHENALKEASGVRTLVLPASVQNLEKDSLSSEYLKRLIFQGNIPPDGLEKAWNSNIIACVTGSELTDWKKAAQSLDIRAGDYGVTTDGYTYLSYRDDDKEQIFLLHAPENAVEYNETAADGKKFTGIGDYAFADAQSLKLAELSESLTQIEIGAFYGCGSLEGVISEADTINIEDDVFSSCLNLRFLVFQAREASIANMGQGYNVGIYAVPDANGYPSNTQTYGNQYVLKTQGTGKILYCMDSAWKLYNAKGEVVEELNVPYLLNATTDISGNVVLEKDTIAIANRAFYNCKKAYTLVNMDTLRIIGDSACAESGLTGVLDLPQLVETIGEKAFSNCTGITSLTIDGTLLDQIDKEAFAGCSGITSITFGENCQLQRIYAYAFAGTSITEIDIPASVQLMQTAVFEECMELKEIRFYGTEPPELLKYGPNIPYSFGGYLTENYEYVNLDIRIKLQGDAQANRQAYIDAWKEAFCDENWTIPEESSEGEIQ